MHCASCAANINRKLKKLPGVKDSYVNYGNGQAMVVSSDEKTGEQEIEKTVKTMGYQPHMEHDHSHNLSKEDREKELKEISLKLTVSIFLTLILLFGAMVPGVPTFIKNMYFMWVLASVVEFWIGLRYFKSAYSAMLNKTTNMDTLIALGTGAAYFYSVFVIIFGSTFTRFGIAPNLYFETSATIITLVLLGKYLELTAKGKASEAIEKLVKLAPKIAHLVKNNEIIDLNISEVKENDILLVKPGEQIPVDGIVISGESAVDQSMITGESLPVEIKKETKVFGGTLNQDGSFQMKALKVGESTMLSRIIKLVEEAQGTRASVQNLVDVISSYFVPAVITLSIVTFIVWLIFGPQPSFIYAFNAAIAVLIIACPCALGLATPTSLTVAMGKGAQNGIFVKNAQSLETAYKTKAVIFDKTGTLTEGKPRVLDVFFNKKIAEKEQADWWRKILALEKVSHHPLSKAIVDFGNKVVGKSDESTIDNFKNISGFGIEGKVNDIKLLIGNKKMMENAKVEMPQEFIGLVKNWQEKAYTVSYVAVHKEVIAVLAIADSPKNTSKEEVHKLAKMNIHTVMLTGDSWATAMAVASELGIKEIKAEVLPDEKEEVINQLKNKYQVVAMVGDGINDAPALNAANVGIAMGNGSDIALETADAALLKSDISLVSKFLNLSKKTITNIKQNLFWAFGYNVILIPIAAGILYPFFKLQLNPSLAAFAMAFSSVSVVLNSLRLRRTKL